MATKSLKFSGISTGRTNTRTDIGQVLTFDCDFLVVGGGGEGGAAGQNNTQGGGGGAGGYRTSYGQATSTEAVML